MNDFVVNQKEALELATKLANDALILYRKKIEQKNNQSKRKYSTFTVGNWVYLKKPLDAVQHGLSHKLDTKSLGPYKIMNVDGQKANATIQLAPNYNTDVKNNLVRLSKDQDILLETNELKPSKTNEIIVLKSIPEIQNLQNQQTSASTKNKKQLKIPEDLVGKRIKVLWKTGPYKGWHNATVVGYTANKTRNLLFYDQRNIHTDISTDYYAHNLSLDSKEEWKLL